MDKILYLDHVDQYNRLYGLETLHPLDQCDQSQ